MATKNFIVKARPVKKRAKGVANLLRYLNNAKAPSHKNTEIIIFNDNRKEFYKNCLTGVDFLHLQNKKGGRPVNHYAQSFSFNLPRSIACTVEQWKAMHDEFSEHICSYLGIERDDFYANLHKEKFKNSHLNFMISKVVFDRKENKYRSLYDLDRLNFLYSLKCKFNELVKKHLDFDIADYEVENKTNPATQEFNHIQSVALPELHGKVAELAAARDALQASLNEAAEALKVAQKEKEELDEKIRLTRENSAKQLARSREIRASFNRKLKRKDEEITAKKNELNAKKAEIELIENRKIVRYINAILRKTEVEDLRKQLTEFEFENKELAEFKAGAEAHLADVILEKNDQIKELKKKNKELKEKSLALALQNSSPLLDLKNK